MTNLYLKTSKKKKNSRWTLTVKALVFNLKLILLLFFVHISAHHLMTHTPSPSSRCLWSTKARHVFLCRIPHPPLHVLVGRLRASWTTVAPLSDPPLHIHPNLWKSLLPNFHFLPPCSSPSFSNQVNTKPHWAVFKHYSPLRLPSCQISPVSLCFLKQTKNARMLWGITIWSWRDQPLSTPCRSSRAHSRL